MIADVRERLLQPGQRRHPPRRGDGHEYSIPTHDHAFITPRGNRVIVVDDEGTTNVLGLLHINTIVDQRPNGEM